MAEPTGALLGQLPVSFVRPERGKFFTDKTRPHAHRRVVPRDRIAVNRPKQPAAKQRPGRAARLDGDEQVCVTGNHAQQPGQTRVVEMVQNFICDNDFRRGRSLQPVKNVRDDRLRAPAERCESRQRLRRHDFLAVEQRHVHFIPCNGAPVSQSAAFRRRVSRTRRAGGRRSISRNKSRHAQQEIAVARAEFDDVSRRAAIHGGLQRVRHDGVVAHPGVEPAQVAARASSARVVRRQFIE